MSNSGREAASKRPATHKRTQPETFCSFFLFPLLLSLSLHSLRSLTRSISHLSLSHPCPSRHPACSSCFLVANDLRFLFPASDEWPGEREDPVAVSIAFPSSSSSTPAILFPSPLTHFHLLFCSCKDALVDFPTRIHTLSSCWRVRMRKSPVFLLLVSLLSSFKNASSPERMPLAREQKGDSRAQNSFSLSLVFVLEQQ